MKRLLVLVPLVLIAGASAAIIHRQGEKVATGEPAAAASLVSRCAFCHGPDGQSESDLWPSLAGMDAAYIEQQLTQFAAGAEGSRKTAHAPQMYAVSAMLGERELREISAYYAGLAPAAWSAESGPAVGRELYRTGADGIASCASCHGAVAEGMPALGAPRLAGQRTRYTRAQLAAYADGSREENGSGMAAIARALSEDQLGDIADYLEGADQPL